METRKTKFVRVTTGEEMKESESTSKKKNGKQNSKTELPSLPPDEEGKVLVKKQYKSEYVPEIVQAIFTKVDLMEAIVNSSGFISEIAAKLKTSVFQIKRAFEKWPDAHKLYLEFKDANLDLAESKLLEKIGKGDITAIIFYLKCLGKDRGYIERLADSAPKQKGSVKIIKSPAQANAEAAGKLRAANGKRKANEGGNGCDVIDIQSAASSKHN